MQLALFLRGTWISGYGSQYRCSRKIFCMLIKNNIGVRLSSFASKLLQERNLVNLFPLAKFHPSVHSLSADHLVQKRTYDSIWASESQALTVGERTGTDAETFQGVLEVIARSNEWGEEGADQAERRRPDSTNIFRREVQPGASATQDLLVIWANN